MLHSPKHSTVSPWIARFLPLVQAGGTVLDVACGSGRHAKFAADTGYRVTAVDRDISRLSDITGIEAIEADLEDGNPWPLPVRKFDGVIVTNYLYRPLFPALMDCLSPGGVLIYETFALGNERFGRPRNPDFLLRPGELLEAVAGILEVVAYEAGVVADPAPAVVQRISAKRPEVRSDPSPLPA